MDENKSSDDTSEAVSSFNPTPLKFVSTAKNRLGYLFAIQTEQLEKLQDVNKRWIDRMQSQATLASELSARLTAARSIPEVATAYQEWTGRHMEMAADDAKRFFADGQKLAEVGARLWSDG